MSGKRKNFFLCKCGCGEYARKEGGYTSGHSPRSSKKRLCHKRTCKLCNQEFMSADAAKSCICSICKIPKLCECGCGKLTNSGLKKYLAGHGSRMETKVILDGREKRRAKIKGDLNPAKKSGMIISEGLRKYWANLSEEERKERLKDNFLINNHYKLRHRKKRASNGGFLSSWEKAVAEYFESNGLFRCTCHEENCIRGWHYEEDRKFWDNQKYYPDFVYNGVIIEVIGQSYILTPQRVLTRLLKIAESGHIYVIVTIKRLAEEFEQYGFGPTFLLNNLKPLLPFLRGSDEEDTTDRKDCLLKAIRDRFNASCAPS